VSVANFLRYDVVVMESFVQFSAFYDFKTATIVSMPLLLVVIAVVLFEYFYVRKTYLHASVAHYSLSITPGKWGWALEIMLFLISFVLVLLPFMGIVKAADMASVLAALEQAFDPLVHSVVYALIGATLLVIVGFMSAYVVAYRTIFASSYLNTVLLLLFVMPSTLIGIAMILFWNHRWSELFYASAAIIIVGYLLKYLFLSTKIIEMKLRQIPTTFVEAAALSGASYTQIIRYILVPFLTESFVITWCVGLIFALRESTITMLVAQAGTTTLPLYILTQMANGKETMIASLSLLMMMLIVLPLMGVVIYMRRVR